MLQYGLPFYMQYMAHWPEYFQVAESPTGEIMGYSKLFTHIINYLHYLVSVLLCIHRSS